MTDVTDGIGARGIHSYRDLGLVFATQPVLSSPATRRVIGEVPYAHGVLEFTQAYGQPYKSTRTLECAWEITAPGPDELEAKRSEVENWLGRIVDEDITYDNALEGYHLHGTCSSVEVEYEEYGDKLTLTASFELYPFQVADTVYTQLLQIGTTTVHNGGWPVRLTATPKGNKATIQIGSMSQTITARTELSIPFESGDNSIVVADGAVTLEWTEERI